MLQLSGSGAVPTASAGCFAKSELVAVSGPATVGRWDATDILDVSRFTRAAGLSGAGANIAPRFSRPRQRPLAGLRCLAHYRLANVSRSILVSFMTNAS